MVNYRRGLGRDLEARLDAQLIARNSGILDGFIQDYHDVFGLECNGNDIPAGRGNIPKGRSIFAFQNANGTGISEGNAFGLGDTTLSVSRQISRGKFASAARVRVKLPTGSGSLWAFFSENGDYTNYNAPFFGNIGPDLTFCCGYEFRR